MNDRITWSRRLDNIEARGYADADDRHYVGSWTSCALSEQHVPKTMFAEPLDPVLEQQGLTFMNLLEDMSELKLTRPNSLPFAVMVERARDLLARIGQRAQEIRDENTGRHRAEQKFEGGK